MRCLRRLALVGLATAFSFDCASTQPTETAPLPPPVAATPSVRTVLLPASPRDTGTAGAFAVEGDEGLARLCETLRDENSMAFSGNAVAQAQEREEHARRRQDAERRRYVAVVPAQGFALANYELRERRLVLDTGRGFRLADDAELLTNLETGAIGFRLSSEAADRILVERAAGKVSLRVVFRPIFSKLRQQACMWISGGGVVKMEIDLETVALLAPDGSRLAQGDNSPDSDLDAPVTNPQIAIKRPRSPTGGDVPDTLARASTDLGPLLLPCYQKALELRPSLRGTLVLGIKIGPDGSVEESHMELSSLGDEFLAACAAAKAGKAKLKAGPGRMSVTVVFGSKDDR
ncbi:MAG TPA: hypothetical protein VJ801_04410 [Polyangia bacterium]|jgi:hypothetical protein|nr:hypothetical protein [Polyangia bacterium]